MSSHRVHALFGMGFLLGALVLLYIGVRGLLGFAIVLPTKSWGLHRFTGPAARVGGGVYFVFGVLLLRLSYYASLR